MQKAGDFGSSQKYRAQLMDCILNLLAAAENSIDGAAAEGSKLRKPQPESLHLQGVTVKQICDLMPHMTPDGREKGS